MTQEERYYEIGEASYEWVGERGDTEGVHLWTIQDAKDGDVLQLGEVTAIFKKYIGQEKCICYCSIDEDGVFEIPIEDGEDNIYGCTNTTPATKEQRALLFQKMNEEGYEWNAELKKVSKITTPADVGFEELGKAWAEEANKQNLANSAKTCKKSQRMISAEAKEALYDKLTWSEEDEEMLDGIILRCKKYGHQEQINWLKSLKERHTWKPSDEQMYMLEWLTTNVLDDGVVRNKAKEVLNTLIEQLKSL